MRDHHGRSIDNLRISLTQRCQYDCDYCHHEGERPAGEEMSLERVKEIVATAAGMGIRKIKLTGGEPMLRTDIIDIIKAIKSQEGIEDLSLVTNGLSLAQKAQELKDAGLDRVNIGCDTISTGASQKTTESIMPALLASKKAGFSQIKLNMVVLKGINDHEIEDMLAFAKEHGAVLQLIELIETDKDYYEQHYYSLDRIDERLAAIADSVTERDMHSRKQYLLGAQIVETVKPFKQHFCEQCTRLRVTSDGRLKPCLMRDDNIVIYSDEGSFRKALKNKRIYSESKHQENPCAEEDAQERQEGRAHD